MNEFFHKQINELGETFPNIGFAYYRSKSGSFNAIVVRGIGLYENSNLIDEQAKIIDEFDSIYPSEDISFLEINEVSVFPGLECVIDFRDTLYDWFSDFQFDDRSFANYVVQQNQDANIQCRTYALAA